MNKFVPIFSLFVLIYELFIFFRWEALEQMVMENIVGEFALILDIKIFFSPLHDAKFHLD